MTLSWKTIDMEPLHSSKSADLWEIVIILRLQYRKEWHHRPKVAEYNMLRRDIRAIKSLITRQRCWSSSRVAPTTPVRRCYSRKTRRIFYRRGCRPPRGSITRRHSLSKSSSRVATKKLSKDRQGLSSRNLWAHKGEGKWGLKYLLLNIRKDCSLNNQRRSSRRFSHLETIKTLRMQPREFLKWITRSFQKYPSVMSTPLLRTSTISHLISLIFLPQTLRSKATPNLQTSTWQLSKRLRSTSLRPSSIFARMRRS